MNLWTNKDNDKRGRLSRVKIPQSYLDRKSRIKEASTKELVSELRMRRAIHAAGKETKNDNRKNGWYKFTLPGNDENNYPTEDHGTVEKDS